MEDSYCIVSRPEGTIRTEITTHAFAVLDGHGGSAVASRVAEAWPSRLRDFQEQGKSGTASASQMHENIKHFCFSEVLILNLTYLFNSVPPVGGVLSLAISSTTIENAIRDILLTIVARLISV